MLHYVHQLVSIVTLFSVVIIEVSITGSLMLCQRTNRLINKLFQHLLKHKPYETLSGFVLCRCHNLIFSSNRPKGKAHHAASSRFCISFIALSSLFIIFPTANSFSHLLSFFLICCLSFFPSLQERKSGFICAHPPLLLVYWQTRIQ